MSPQLHVTVVQSQAKPPLLGDPAFCLVPASQFSYNCKLCSVTPWSSLCLWYFENELGATVIFGLFAIYWVILRLIFFPFWVIKCLRFACMINDLMPPYLICWWVLISLMIWRQLKSGQLREDIRSGNLIPYNSFART
ncbi:hypothetical protein CUMW_231360 [Citrus unshiu]|uniref:Uncharacterized protein n=1 Tax=Citrus unshiu TaxID=55188 RepID=A0A2H5QHP3_CITUN|nr:hypothetical protein CUMW_231360 [Citrus unshiu]